MAPPAGSGYSAWCTLKQIATIGRHADQQGPIRPTDQMQGVLRRQRQPVDDLESGPAIFTGAAQCGLGPSLPLQKPEPSTQDSQDDNHNPELLKCFHSFPRQTRGCFSKTIRTPMESPAFTISPELNRAPPTYRSTGEPTDRDNRIKLPGARERISRTDKLHRPNSDSTGSERVAKCAMASAVIKEKTPLSNSDYGWICNSI